MTTAPVAFAAAKSAPSAAALHQQTATTDPALGANAARLSWSNWAGTVRCVPSYFHTPRTLADIRTVIAFARSHGHRVRVVGFGHSPGSIVDASDVVSPPAAGSVAAAAPVPVHLLALGLYFRALESLDADAQQVTVQPGMSLLELNALLDSRGLALSALGSISDQTIGGALACGTHGSSSGAHALLAAYVVRLELLDAEGTLWRCSASENADLFNAARVSLGCLGVITSVTLQCEAAYDLVERSCAITFDDLVCEEKFERMVLHDPHADFVRFHWIPHTDRVVYTRMQKVYGAQALRDSVVAAERLARSTALAQYVDRLRRWKERMVGFHVLQALYYVSTFGTLDRTMVPAIARLYNRIVFPPPGAPFPPAASAPAVPAAPSLPGLGTSGAASTPAPVPLPVPAAGFTRQDRHDRILNFDCLFAQYVTEWAVDQCTTVGALKALRRYIESQELRVHFPVELRFGGGARPRKHDPPVAHSNSNSGSDSPSSASAASVGGDGIWLSPCHSRAQSWIGIIMYRPYGKDVKYRDYFRGFELLLNDTPAHDPVLLAALAAFHASAPAHAPGSAPTSAPAAAGSFLPPKTHFNGKPHWAKNVVMPLDQIDLPRLYPRWEDFKAMRAKMDPTHTFSNAYIHALMDGGDTAATSTASTASTQQQQAAPTLPLPSQL